MFGFVENVCVELDIDALAVNTLLQSHSIHDTEGTAGAVAFDAAPQANLEVIVNISYFYLDFDLDPVILIDLDHDAIYSTFDPWL